MLKKNPDQDTLPFLNLLPNLITMLGLCAGLTSIRFVLAGKFELAAALIVFAALVDGLDGQLARRLNATSDFGSELDSLSDFLNFGVAPALLIFEFTLGNKQGIGWVFVLIYVSCCCMRLARFNVAKNAPPEDKPPQKAHFVGVPAPAAALLVLLPVFLTFEGSVNASTYPLFISLYLGVVGAAMVSRFHTFSPKSILVPKEKIGWILIATAIVVGMMLTQFWLSLVLIDLIYMGILVKSVFSHMRSKTT